MAQTPAQFWHNHLRHGTGGTCFESNLAFLALLQALGFEGYLTINNMGATQACHTATVLVVDGQQWLADAGLPTFAALRLDASAEAVTTTPVLTYTVRPDGPFTFQIERAPHPSPNAFTLLNLPIALDAYWQATRNDYGPHGFFLDKLVINKVIDGQLWRYSSADAPPRMEQFVDGKRVDWTLDGDWVSAVGERFGIDVAILAEAMQAL